MVTQTYILNPLKVPKVPKKLESNWCCKFHYLSHPVASAKLYIVRNVGLTMTIPIINDGIKRGG